MLFYKKRFSQQLSEVFLKNLMGIFLENWLKFPFLLEKTIGLFTR
uniref:Uncharacterized protein n=1 Tax=Enterococcus faecalis TaxID=1351 RepID=A0A7G8A8U4_ENTFL|nr:hypothetical protein [Enterococcus faecalis]QNI15399.1 hypothetical protein [Enterococcus faecalis]QNI15407.1 hypothetical protein [Enterococcus faecalis]QNI15415.1 hypothetical protein [Enterococcus faecalis]QNI15422.1 hypothetical protein [Enterococcus faecalis]